MEQMKNAEKLEFLLDTYGNSLFRLSLMMLQNEADAEDALQDTFIRYLQKAPSFRDDAHEKAWLFRVCTNLCHDRIRCRKRHPHLDLEAQHSLAAEENVLTLTVSLPKDTPPFCYCETLQLPAYSILDEGGHTILRSSTALSSPCTEGEASFLLPLDGLEAGTYTLLIDTFICEKKADQPLPIYGDWHAPFLLE